MGFRLENDRADGVPSYRPPDWDHDSPQIRRSIELRKSRSNATKERAHAKKPLNQEKKKPEGKVGEKIQSLALCCKRGMAKTKKKFKMKIMAKS